MTAYGVRSRLWLLALMGALLLVTTLATGRATAVVPTLAAQKPVSVPRLGVANARQNEPAIAWNGSNYLAVWKDERSGLGGTTGIWASLLSPSGAPLSGAGLVIAETGTQPEVATDGTDFLVVWEQSSRIFGAVVEADGTIAAPGAFEIYSTVGFQQSAPSVAFDGTNYLVAWNDFSGGSGDIKAFRIDPEGDLVEDTPITITSATGSQSNPTVASDGSGWMVAWTDHGTDSGGDINGTDVSSEGIPVDVGGVGLAATAGPENTPRLAANDSGYLLAWSDGDSDTGLYGVTATRLGDDGDVLDTSGIEVAAPGDSVTVGKIGSNGTDYLATYFVYTGTLATSKVYGTLVSDTGVADPAGIEVAPMIGQLSQRPAVASDGTDFMALYGDGDIYSATVLADGTSAGTDDLVTRSAAAQTTGDIAAGGSGYLAVWEERRADDPAKIMAGRLGPDGSPLDGGGITVSASNEALLEPVVAWNGSTYLVVWIDYSTLGSAPDVRGARLDADGTVLDSPPIHVDVGSDAVSQIDVASLGGDFLVVWTGNDGSDADIYGRFVEANGTVPDARFPIDDGAGDQQAPSVAANASRYLVSWLDRAVAPEDGIEAAAIVPGAVDPLQPTQSLTQDAYSPFDPVVASDGSGFHVFWGEGDELSEDEDLWLERFDAAGDPLGPGAPLTDTDLDDELPIALAWDGAYYVAFYSVFPTGDGEPSYVARRIATDGSFKDPSAFPVLPGEGRPLEVASWRSGDALFLYRSLATEDEFGHVDRLFTRRMDNAPPKPLMKAPKGAFQGATSFGVGWSRPSQVVDLRLRQATSKAGFGSYATWKTDAAGTKSTYKGTPGGTYCFAARSRDTDGYVSLFGPDRCTAVPLDDRSLRAKGPWRKGAGKGYYLKTFVETSKKGASLRRAVRAKRLALVATKCPKCGTVKVFLGKKLLKKVSLKSSKTTKKHLIALGSFKKARKGTVRIVVVSDGKVVRIEGLGVSAV